MMKEISKTEFEKEVIANPLLSVVKFTADWSGPCQISEPAFRDIANFYNGKVNFFTVDIDREKWLEKEYGIMEIPTILFFKSGEVVDHLVGLASKGQVISKIEDAIEENFN
jgi:thioredoxin 1